MSKFLLIFSSFFIAIVFVIGFPTKDRNFNDWSSNIYEEEYLDNGLRPPRTLDSLGGGYLLRSAPYPFEMQSAPQQPTQPTAAPKPRPVRVLDSLGGGYLLRNIQFPLTLKGNKGKLDESAAGLYAPRLARGYDLYAEKSLDSIGGGHLIKRTLDSIGGASLL